MEEEVKDEHCDRQETTHGEGNCLDNSVREAYSFGDHF